MGASVAGSGRRSRFPSGLPGHDGHWAAEGFVPGSDYPLRVTPYYASLVAGASHADPIARQCIPRAEELAGGGRRDALNETEGQPLPGLLHVYPDRVLLLATDRCAVNCRHCNRRWRRGDGALAEDDGAVAAWLDYLQRAPGVTEVLVTGGDPLTLAHGTLARLLAGIRQVRREVVVRMGSRIPCVQPSRVTSRLAGLLRRHGPLYLHTQFNCPAECTAEAGGALDRLADAGINLGNQMVLLAGVNDDVESIVHVSRWLVSHRCRPYYLFLPEPVLGTAHFRVDPRRAAALGAALRPRLSGLAMPLLVVDTPDGGGKVPLHPDSLIEVNGCVGVRDLRGRFVEL